MTSHEKPSLIGRNTPMHLPLPSHKIIPNPAVAFWLAARAASIHFVPGEIFKDLLLLNYCVNFNQISQKCSLGGPLSDSFKFWPLGQNLPRPGAYQFFIGKSLKIFSETTGPISTKFYRNVPWVVLFQIPSDYDPRAQTGPVLGLISFSSPEHMLRMSFCDRSPSVRLASVNIFKPHLLWNHWLVSIQTLSAASVHRGNK